uniref:ABC transporter domain-containing protein n=1 Tax=Quercus lobata TaxID=97700 RepID=A0A7N2KZ72_QUELO
MSGGQKQRIAIARAIIKKPRILLLDEATSALDLESERVVQEALDKASVGCTTIVIAHRLSTIRNVDVIAVVKNGQVMETLQRELEENTHASSSISNMNINNTSSRRLSVVSRSSSANSIAGLSRGGSLEWKQASLGCLAATLFGAVQSLVLDQEDSEGYQPEKITGLVEIRDVYFAYPARPDVIIFQGFSINIEAEKSTALVGQSGSGKSTIIGLIERFYDPVKGMVKIVGKDIRSYHLRSLRKHIALVSQEPTLFSGTIRQNIAYGASDKVDETEITEAAKLANAHDFISGLKEGYETSCGDRGVQLSGGQKQRIAIARAILKNPSVLLLDEATSALDSQSEKVVQDALERVMVGGTSVVVAHRLSTIQNCNMIAVLDKGKVGEKGTHSSLLAKGPNGAYYSLVSLQRRAPQNSNSFN